MADWDLFTGIKRIRMRRWITLKKVCRRDIEVDDQDLIGNAYSDIGGIHLQFYRDYTSAINFYNKSLMSRKIMIRSMSVKHSGWAEHMNGLGNISMHCGYTTRPSNYMSKFRIMAKKLVH